MPRAFLLLAAVLAMLPGAAGAAYTQFFAFGDSLSDDGNAFILSGGIWPPSPPYAERFSNGPVAAEYLAAQLGIALAPSATGGTDYAVGGATTGTANFNFAVQSPFALPASLDGTGVLAQVGGFAASGTSFAPAGSLFMVWAAPNDFFLALAQGSDLGTAAANAVDNLVTAITTLVGLGATDLFVPNMPDLSLTPFGLMQTQADRDALAALSLGFNGALALTLDQLQLALLAAQPDFRLTTFDTAAFLGDVIASPAAFGFTNVTDPCLDDLGALLGGCQGYLYFDQVHPTTAAHALLGGRFFASVQQVPEPPAWALIAAALALATLSRSRAQARVVKR